jgi:hypothetical protein
MQLLLPVGILLLLWASLLVTPAHQLVPPMVTLLWFSSLSTEGSAAKLLLQAGGSKAASVVAV